MFIQKYLFVAQCSCHSRSPFYSSQGLSFAVHNQPYLILENYDLEDFSFLVCDGGLLGNWCLTFCRNVAPLNAGGIFLQNAESHLTQHCLVTYHDTGICDFATVKISIPTSRIGSVCSVVVPVPIRCCGWFEYAY
jgi:hypothetical protein